MEQLDEIIKEIHLSFDERTIVRDRAIHHGRMLTRNSANAIRAIHRDERDLAIEHLTEAKKLVCSLKSNHQDHPEIFFAGYTQDALKEYAEASITCALVTDKTLPSPEELSIDYVPFLKGLAEAVGELRRKCLDIIRHGHSDQAERLLSQMDDIYSSLVTMDYPDAITRGLRRLTDITRSILERTRGDITLSHRQERLENQLRRMEELLSER